MLPRVWLDNNGDLELEPVEDEFEQLIIDLGLAHEQAILENLASTAEIHTATTPEDTTRLMAERVPVIYQARQHRAAPGPIQPQQMLCPPLLPALQTGF